MKTKAAEEVKFELDQFKTEVQHTEMEQNQTHRFELIQKSEREQQLTVTINDLQAQLKTAQDQNVAA